jgi:hypothetical protein
VTICHFINRTLFVVKSKLCSNRHTEPFIFNRLINLLLNDDIQSQSRRMLGIHAK